MTEDQQTLALRGMDRAERECERYSRKYRHLEDEFVSEAGLALCRAAILYDPTRGPFEPYVCAKVRNALKDVVRADAKRMRLLLYSDVIDKSLPFRVKEEDLEAFEAAIAEAPFETRDLLRLLFIYDLSFTEAAEALGQDPETIADMFKSASWAMRDGLPAVRFQSAASRPRKSPDVDVMSVILVSIAG